MKSNQSKVLGMVLKGYPRISETFISNEIGLLEERGFSIHIFSMRNPRENFSHKSIKRIKAGVTYLPSTLFSSLHRFFLPNLRTYRKNPQAYRKALGMMCRSFMINKKAASIKHVLQAGYLVDHLSDGGDVTHLHAHFAHSPTSVARYAALLGGLTFSFTGHAKDIYTQKADKVAKKLEQASFAVTCTNYNKRYLQELSPEGKPVHCVYHGIDLSLFSSRADRVQTKQPYRIMTVARMVEKKGLPTVLSALALLKQRGVRFEYVLVGSGDDKEKVRALIKKLGLEQYTTLTGTITHDQVLEHYRAADLFVLGCQVAANGDRDGIPNVLAEAMAMGVPVAATTVSGIPELVRNAESGLLVEPKNPAALADAMLKLLTDFELRARVIPEARKTVSRIFDNQPLSSKLAEIYEAEGLGPGQTQV